MELDNSAQTTKKSGFSFRKRRSNSKTRKSDAERPVDMEKDEEINDDAAVAEIAKSDGNSAPVESGDGPVLGKDVEPEASAELKTDEDEATPLSVNDSSPEGVKSEEFAKGPTKKKAKRKSRSLFRRSSKNKDAKNAESCEESAEKKEGEAQCDEKPEAKAAALDVSDVSDGKAAEQVVADESGERSEVGEQSDGEYAGAISGAASEGEDLDDKNGEEKDAATSDEKKGEQKEGTKKKKFFKRGLSLRRSKSKKNHEDGGGDGGEAAKEEKPCAVTKEVKKTCEIGVSTDSRLDLSQFAARNDIGDGGTPPVEIKEDNHAEISEEKTTEGSDKEDGNVVAKKSPAKPARTVSFAEPEHVAAESPYEGDSPSEDPKEVGEKSQDVTPSPVVVEAAPSELPSEAEGETKDPEKPKVELVDDDDELTEVSSVTSSLVASSDAHSQLDPQETMSCVFAVESGSRITLLESDEFGEGSGSRPDEPTKDGCEGDELLGEEEKAKKDGEWIMLNQSYDVSGELQRMRKQTLFGVKRLCCSVM